MKTLNETHRNGTKGRTSTTDYTGTELGACPTHNEQTECNAAAAVTALARGYAAELAKRVRGKALPYSLSQYMQERTAEVEAQARELGTPASVPA